MQSTEQQRASLMPYTAVNKVVSQLRLPIASLSPHRPGFAPWLVHVGFIIDSVPQGQVSLRVLRSSPVLVIPPWLSILIYLGGGGVNERPVDILSSET
jgi:hypothetical protein